MAANDLHTVFRPCTFDEMLGNKTNIDILKQGLNSGNLSHCFLFTGDAGCGKTTAARILSFGLQCDSFLSEQSMTSKPCPHVDHGITNNKESWCSSCRSIMDHNNIDVQEVNVGATGGKDAVDKITNDLSSAPFNSRHKIVIFDEAHKLTLPAQDLLLKVIEDGFSYVYFIFTTNHPEKLTDAFVSRCSVMHFDRISKQLIFNMLENVAQFEGMTYENEVIEFIADQARGVPRTALVLLKQASDEGSWTVEAIKDIVADLSAENDPQVIEISRALIKGSFKTAFSVYDKVKKKKGPESVRIGIVAYLTGCLKRAKSYTEGDRFSTALDIFNVPIYEQGRVGDYKLYHYLYKTSRIFVGK
jgi:DNA polymerase-3 subunit gamma/tau